MRIFLKAFLLFALFFVAAHIIRISVVPNTLPIADGDQSGWQVQIAFVLMSVENIGLFGMAIVAVLALVSRFRRLVAR
jgi:branched-subunit amino acid permease